MRRILLAVAIAGTVVALSLIAASLTSDSPPDGRDGRIAAEGDVAPSSTRAPATTTTTQPVPDSDGTLTLLETVTGDIAPKSVVASGRGLVFAQNMMYKHSVTVYDKSGRLVNTIPDSVDLAAFGVPDHPGISRARRSRSRSARTAPRPTCPTTRCTAPASAPRAATIAALGRLRRQLRLPGGRRHIGDRRCLEVGSVPKYVATTPDGRYVVVTNWCTFDASIIDTATQTEVRRIPLGPLPARDRDHARLADRIRRRDGEPRTSPASTWVIRGLVDLRGRRRAATPGDVARRLHALRDVERRGHGRQDRCPVRHRGRPRSPRPSPAQHGDLGRRQARVRRELRVGHHEQARRGDDGERPGRPDRLSPDRHHLRPHDRQRLGGELHGVRS